MSDIKELKLDLLPTNVLFDIQCTDGTGLKVDPSAANLIIYEDDGDTDETDLVGVTGSPFTPAKLMSKTGWYGIAIAKSVFTAGKAYHFLWEMTVDGITTSKRESYTACNAADFKATGFSTLAATDILSSGQALDTTLGVLDVVNLVNTTTTNTDMVGTDNAALASVATEARLAELDSANLPADVDRNANLIETQKGHHTYQGDVWYVDPINGNDSTGDGSKVLPYLTVTKAHTEATDYNHDVIFLVAGQSGAETVLDEQVTISKNYLFIRGPGRDFLWKSTSTGNVITITGEGVELSGFKCETHTSGSGDAVAADGATFLRIENVWFDYARSNSISITQSDFVVVCHCTFHDVGENAASSAIDIISGTAGAEHITVQNCYISHVTGDGISMSETVGDTEHVIISNCWITHCSAWAVSVGVGVSEIGIYDMHMMNNTLGSIDDQGTDNHLMNNEQWGTEASVDRNANLIETQRGAHTWQGNMYYVDPVNGDTYANGNRGGRADPYLGVQDCHDNSVTDSNHDVIILVAGHASTVTTLTEDVTISKRYCFIRGPGRDFIWTRSGAGDTIAVTGDGVELSGFQLETAAVGVGNGVQISGADFVSINHVWVNDTRGDGININQGTNCQIRNNHFQGTGAGGAAVGLNIVGTGSASDDNHIENNFFEEVAGDAIKLGAGTVDNTTIKNNAITGSSGWAINISATSTDTLVCGNLMNNNTSGNITDSGTNTTDANNSAWAKHSIATETRLAELDAANLPADVDTIAVDVAGLDGAAMRGTDGANTTTPPTVAQIQAELEENGASILDTLRDDLADGGRLDLIFDAILEDTATTLPAAITVIDDFLDTEIAAILEDTGTTIPAQITALNDISAANVLTQVNAALDTAIAEPADITSTKSLRNLMFWSFARFYFKTTQTAEQQKVYKADNSTANATATVSTDGTTQTRTKGS